MLLFGIEGAIRLVMAEIPAKRQWGQTPLRISGLFVPEHLNVGPVLTIGLRTDIELLPDRLT